MEKLKIELKDFNVTEEFLNKVIDKLPKNVLSITVTDVYFKYSSANDKGTTYIDLKVDFTNEFETYRNVDFCISKTSYDWEDRKDYQEAIDEYQDHYYDSFYELDKHPYTSKFQKWTEDSIFIGLSVFLEAEIDNYLHIS
jgi:hypothetical protein